jgi:predicted enzyme related to lactoylglutathione lyase
LALQVQTESPEFSILGAGTISLALNRGLGRAMTPNAHSMEIVFPVQSVSESRTVLAGRGAPFVNEPHEVSPGSWAATLTDPDGHYITIFGSK